VWCTQALLQGSIFPLPERLQDGLRVMPVNTLAGLLLCEQVLDALGMVNLRGTGVYKMLEGKAASYLRASPHLLLQPWLRNGGAVFDLVSQLSAEMHVAAQVLARFRLGPAPTAGN
jgi:hypothetical protein